MIVAGAWQCHQRISFWSDVTAFNENHATKKGNVQECVLAPRLISNFLADSTPAKLQQNKNISVTVTASKRSSVLVD